MPCELSILLPFIVPPSASTGLFSLLDQGLEGAAPGYPPYNIERTGENEYRVSVAVAGFNEPELSIVAKENTLTIRGEKNAKEEEKRGDVLYQGIAARTFERVFQLADFVQVKGASLENGLLHVDLVREIPEAKKPRSIPIGNSKADRRPEAGCVSSLAGPKRERPGFPGRFRFAVSTRYEFGQRFEHGVRLLEMRQDGRRVEFSPARAPAIRLANSSA